MKKITIDACNGVVTALALKKILDSFTEEELSEKEILVYDNHRFCWENTQKIDVCDNSIDIF